ncbi:MAG TPA: hypothetical protein VNF04_10205 [Stellaceae bacterium]|nr:hypothetical protein [Stellaceae bacterium]
MLMGYVDLADRDRIIGWAADSAAPDKILVVAIVIDGHEIGRARADRLRPDLREAGTYGDGRHGFEFEIRSPLDPAAEHHVAVRFANSDTALTHGVFTIARGEDAGFNLPAGSVDRRDRPSQRHESATARPRYIIHVGLPKTGTKYLQSAFWRLRNQLLTHGIYYPSEWWQPGPAFAHHALVQELKQVPDDRIADIFSKLNNCGKNIVLLSCENFINVPDHGLEYLRDLTQGAEIDIVFYTRRWSDWIPSQWQQAIKEGSVWTLPEWYAFLMLNAERHPGIDQAIFIDKFSRIFGRDRIKLISYSTLMDYEIDIFKHFCQEILYLPDLPEMSNTSSIVHGSMGIFLTEMIRCLNAKEILDSNKAGYHIYGTYDKIRDDPEIVGDVRTVFDIMRETTATISIDDYAVFLKDSYSRLNDYRDLLVSPEYCDQVFKRECRSYQFVRSDYLMHDDAVEAMRRISRALRTRMRRPATAERQERRA